MKIKNQKIIKIEKIDSDSKRYDITIENNHNMFANNILIHNCQNLLDHYEDYKKEEWIESEKIDGCLDENTIIETEDGIKTIREICESKYTEKIKSFDLEKNEIVFSKILGHSIKENIFIKTRLLNESRPKFWYEVELENGLKIRLTENHEIWIPELMCWRRADELDGSEEFLVRN